MLIVLMDIDGVLANITHLIPLIRPSLRMGQCDYDQYYARLSEALPIPEGLALMQALLKGHCRIKFFTGRREICREATQQWIQDHLGMPVGDYELHMRRDNDWSKASLVKAEMVMELKNKGLNGLHQVIAFDDDREVIAMYEWHGIYACHVKHEHAKSA
jgi:hypothetical protein